MSAWSGIDELVWCVRFVSKDADDMGFKCRVLGCGNRSFSRWNEFARRYNGACVVELKVFWCFQSGCNRSRGAEGNKPFPRTDKRDEHKHKMHASQ